MKNMEYYKLKIDPLSRIKTFLNNIKIKDQFKEKSLKNYSLTKLFIDVLGSMIEEDINKNNFKTLDSEKPEFKDINIMEYIDIAKD